MAQWKGKGAEKSLFIGSSLKKPKQLWDSITLDKRSKATLKS